MTAQEVRAEKRNGGKAGTGVSIHIANMTVRKDSDIDDIANVFVRKFINAVEGGA